MLHDEHHHTASDELILSDKNSENILDFLAKFSHEIRTPLNGIIGITSLLSETRMSDTQRDYLDLMKESSLLLLSFVNDLLDYWSIKNNKLQVHYKPFKVRDLIERCHYIMLPKVTEKNLKLDFYVDTNTPDYLISDNNRISQILINLLNNSVRYTKKGSILTKVSYNNKHLCISVSDTGIGIAPEVISYLFQLNTHSTGTGLGLTISKNLCELLHGSIELNYTGETGTQFTFTIPCEASIAELNTTELQTLEKLKNCYVLIVDDNQINRISVSGMCARLNMIPIPTSSLSEALILTQHFDFKLGLIDIYLEKSNGIEVAKRLKKNNHLFPLIALSSLGDKLPNFQNYFDDFLTKPIREERLFSTIKKVLHLPSKLTSFSKNNSITSLEKGFTFCKIVILDNKKLNQRLLSGLLHLFEIKKLKITCLSSEKELLDTIQKDETMLIFVGIKIINQEELLNYSKCVFIDTYGNNDLFVTKLDKPITKNNLQICLEKIHYDLYFDDKEKNS